jgi:hypothetical protein
MEKRVVRRASALMTPWPIPPHGPLLLEFGKVLAAVQEGKRPWLVANDWTCFQVRIVVAIVFKVKAF